MWHKLLSQMNNALNNSSASGFDYVSDRTFLVEKMTLSELERTVVNQIRQDHSLFYDVSVNLENCQPNSQRTAFVVLGAIGCGKSTLTRLLYSKGYFTENLEFLCEDLIKWQHFNDISPLKSAYRCAKVYLHYKLGYLLQNGHNFVYELVPSNKDKIKTLNLIKDSGYKIISIYICTDSEQININRVASRMALGADFVPAEKIVSRFYSTQEHLDDIVFLSDFVYLIDSSGVGFKLIGYSGDKQIVLFNK